MDPEKPQESGSLPVQNRNTNNPNPAERRRRLFAFILVVGLASIVIGAFSIYDAIRAPFPRPRTNTTNQVARSAAFENLKRVDTDGDGLSDYDEIFTYHTSIFVKDSDSDGISDADEVRRGTDPNCPQGKTCGIASVGNVNSPIDTSALRESLKQSGAPAYALDQTDDATLLKLYKQTILGDVNATANLSTDDLRNLSASQVRSLLKSNGVDETSLRELDDATLLQIYQDALAIDTTTTNP